MAGRKSSRVPWFSPIHWYFLKTSLHKYFPGFRSQTMVHLGKELLFIEADSIKPKSLA